MKHTHGYTLVETIIVLAIVAVIMPAVFSIIYAITSQQADLYRLSQMKSEGDFAFEFIKNRIQTNTSKIYTDDTLNTEKCPRYDLDPSTDDSFYAVNDGEEFVMTLKNNSARWFTISLDGNNKLIFTEDGPGGTITEELTSDSTYVPYFHIECTRDTPYSLPVIGIQFAIVYKNQSGQPVNLNPLIYYSEFRLQ